MTRVQIQPVWGPRPEVEPPPPTPASPAAQPLLMVLYEGWDAGSRGLLAAFSVR